MVVVDAEDEMAEAVGIIEVTDGSDRTQEWYSAIMSHRYECNLPMTPHHMNGTGYQRLRRSELEKNYHITRSHVKMMVVHKSLK